MRKTIKVEELKDYVNEKLMNPNVSEDAKYYFCQLMEKFLNETENYKGTESIIDSKNRMTLIYK